MKETKLTNLLRCIIDNFNTNDKFDLEEIINLTNMKLNTVYKNLLEILKKYDKCFEIDNQRRPFKYNLLNRDLLINLLIKDMIPDFLLKFIDIKIK